MPKSIMDKFSIMVYREIGEAFFDDQTRLHRDLLMDEATLYLKTLF